MFQAVDDRRLDKGDKRADGQKLDNGRKDAQDIENRCGDNDRTHNGPNADERQAGGGKPEFGGLTTTRRGIPCHYFPITPSGSILS